MIAVYVAQTLLSWSHVVSETTRMSDAHIVCIFKTLPCIRVSCPCHNDRVHAT